MTTLTTRNKPALTPERLRELLDYEPSTGIFRWRTRRRGNGRMGTIAGSLLNRDKIWRIGIDERDYLAHRLAWLFVHGIWPPDEIDHINGDPLDNRIANLRPATSAQNKMNTRCHKDTKSGFKGVRLIHFWKATIWVDGKGKHLGCFKTAEAAHAAYVRAATKFFGEFANPGTR